MVDTGTSKKNNLEDEKCTYKATYHKPKQKYIHLEDRGKCLQIEKGHRMDPEWNYKKRKKYYLEKTHLIKKSPAGDCKSSAFWEATQIFL